MARKRVLFLCTHNSARSQMAEGYLRAVAGDRYEVASAGTTATHVHPLAVQVMHELGVDLQQHAAKTLDVFAGQGWDYVITVCDDAAATCPVFPGATVQLHWAFPDPSQAVGTAEERLQVFRRVRDAITARIRAWLVEQGQRPR